MRYSWVIRKNLNPTTNDTEIRDKDRRRQRKDGDGDWS